MCCPPRCRPAQPADTFSNHLDPDSLTLSEKGPTVTRYFLTYRSVRLPLQLAEELSAEDVRNRNTYFAARYDAAGRLSEIDKCVYGEVEMTHRYTWDEASGQLAQAVIQVGEEEPQVLALLQRAGA